VPSVAGTASGGRIPLPEIEHEALRDRARGVMAGMAIVDALGSAVEFCPPGLFPPVTMDAFQRWDAYPNPHRLPAGAFTDDTSMGLCLGASLVERLRVDPVDLLMRFRRWMLEGYMSATGKCFDIGTQTRSALSRHSWASQPLLPLFSGVVGSNGCIMRLGPLPIFLLSTDDVGTRAAAAAAQCRTTHSTPTCIQACILMSELVRAALLGEPKAALLVPGRWAPLFDEASVREVEGAWPLAPGVAGIIAASYAGKAPGRAPTGIVASAQADHTLEAALWALAGTSTFADGALKAVNLGNDSDTVGAVYGIIAGGVYGHAAIPEPWRRVAVMADVVVTQADALLAVAIGANFGVSPVDVASGGAGAEPAAAAGPAGP
jgi:ADP-ribosyl-[dinitrogen reductase] hydrolase